VIPQPPENPDINPPPKGDSPNGYPIGGDNVPDLPFTFPSTPPPIGEGDTGATGEGFTIPEFEIPTLPRYPIFIPPFPGGNVPGIITFPPDERYPQSWPPTWLWGE
jgi:hypothetical protein